MTTSCHDEDRFFQSAWKVLLEWERRNVEIGISYTDFS
jgi:hypothetical protein